MRIGIDVDGVLADFNTAFIERAISVTGTDRFPPRPFDIPCWHYPQHYGYILQEVDAIWETIKNDETFWMNLSPYPGTFAALDVLSKKVRHGAELYFITARPGYRAKHQTEVWLESAGMPLPTVLISSAKEECAHALDLQYYIDDRIENVIDVVTFSRAKTFLMSRPWNVMFDEKMAGVRRVSSIHEMFTYPATNLALPE